MTILVVEAISALLTQLPHRVTSRCKGLGLALTYRQDTQSRCAVGDIVSILGREACSCLYHDKYCQHSVLAVSRIESQTRGRRRWLRRLTTGISREQPSSHAADCVFSHLSCHTCLLTLVFSHMAPIPAPACSHKAFMAWLHFAGACRTHATRMPHACASPTDG